MAIVPLVGSVRDCEAGWFVVTVIAGAADWATGGLSAAQAVTRSRGASERARTDDRERSEIGFIFTYDLRECVPTPEQIESQPQR
jgi:hypothetical protein